MNFYHLLKLQWRKTLRSSSAGRKLTGSIALAIIGTIVLLYVLVLGFGLKYLITQAAGKQDVALVLDRYVIFFFLVEMIYRYFLQKVSTIELNHYLHLPIGRPKIIRFLLTKSFISPFNIIVILLFAPSYFLQVADLYGTWGGLSWLFTIILISWSVHWLMVWFQKKFGDRLLGILLIFAVFLVGVGSAWYGWFNIGTGVAPFFSAALQSIIPLLIALLIFAATYYLAYQFYYRHAYLEELGQAKQSRVVGQSLSLFGRLGLAGAMADLELKLAMRHKRSRTALIFSLLFLGYGLIFYSNDTFTFSKGIPAMAIFIGIFITGIFIMQYGQLFLSWNSSHFDFFLDRREGIHALVEGKYLLFFGVSTAAYILSIPYIYFGWQVLLVHTATFLFNIGINLHIIIYLALWNPKPMDLSKRGTFNYEGMGAAQFLMAIPMIGLPYLIYFPLAYFVSDIAGLLALALLGVLGLFFYKQCINLQVHRILKNRYAISSSFRQEL